MKKILLNLCVMALFFTMPLISVMAAQTQRINNSNSPVEPPTVLHPRELWRCGGEDDDFLFGFIITAGIDEEGLVYLLDRWLAAVHVIDPAGHFVRQLSGQGEGPGETNQPTDREICPESIVGNNRKPGFGQAPVFE